MALPSCPRGDVLLAEIGSPLGGRQKAEDPLKINHQARSPFLAVHSPYPQFGDTIRTPYLVGWLCDKVGVRNQRNSRCFVDFIRHVKKV